MKRIFAVFALLASSLLAKAGTPDVSFDGSVTASTTYIWRGTQICGLHFVPRVALHAGGFSIEEASFLSYDGAYKEVDWDLAYSIGDFTFHLFDYYWHDNTSGVTENCFSWKKGETHHIDEASLMYRSSGIPLKASWFTYLWGDWLPKADGTQGRVSFSSYLEIGTWKEFGNFGKGSVDLGFSVFKGPYTDHKKDFAPLLAMFRYGKSFDFDRFSIPVEMKYVINLYRKTAFSGVSIGLAF